jgi:hypothetical protein
LSGEAPGRPDVKNREAEDRRAGAVCRREQGGQGSWLTGHRRGTFEWWVAAHLTLLSVGALCLSFPLMV